MKKKNVSILLLAIMLFQGCVVYQPQPVSLHGARYLGKVKVITKEGEVNKYKSIVLKDSIYFGSKGQILTPLDPEQISIILLQDITKSKSRTSLLVSTIIIASLAFVTVALISAFFQAIGTI